MVDFSYLLSRLLSLLHVILYMHIVPHFKLLSSYIISILICYIQHAMYQ